MSWLADHWPMLAGGTGLLSAGAAVAKLLDRWFSHKRESRRQSDTVALALVEKLQAQMAVDRAEARAEHVLCEKRLSDERHERSNLEAMVMSLFRGFKFVSADRLPDFITDLERDWMERRARRMTDVSTGDLRNDVQVVRSAANLVRDAVAEAGASP